MEQMDKKIWIVAFCDYDVYVINGIFTDLTDAKRTQAYLEKQADKWDKGKFCVEEQTLHDSYTHWVQDYQQEYGK